ncbi:MAG: tryptophan synthase subunit alpha [Bacteroidales bacterium]|nr:tryptophan synthase subunit alpha [Bacteroidales bacterium]
MKNRINSLFENKKEDILSVYFTAGYPELNDTRNIIIKLAESGTQLIEIGIPFSDPVADGPVIQQSSLKALQNGISLKLIFEQLTDIRDKVDIPLIMMGYLNPILQYGIEAFCDKCNEVGIDGVILPDLTPELYLENYKDIFESRNIHMIFLISPQTTNERLKFIDNISNGFVYMVSSSSTTGAKSTIQKEQEEYFNRVSNLELKNPRLIGFGISNHQTFKTACSYANGAIIGSAFVKALEGEIGLDDKIERFVEGILEG